MKNNPSYTLLDNRIVWCLILFSGLALLVLAIRYYLRKPFNIPAISVKQGPLYTGELIRFSVQLPDKTPHSVVWDFGDNTNPLQEGAKAHHIYSMPGIYEVTATIGRQHKSYHTLSVFKQPSTQISAMQPRIIGPDKAQAGQPVSFQDATPHATQWEWLFGETGNVDAVTPQASYTYQSTGLKTILLIVNGKMQGTHRIWVEQAQQKTQELQPPATSRTTAPATNRMPLVIRDKPQTSPLNLQLNKEKTQEEKEALKSNTQATSNPPTDILKQTIETMLLQVLAGRKEAADFSAYLCTHLNMPVLYNGNEMTFTEFCSELKKFKKEKKIRSITVHYDTNEQTNCIRSMKVDLKKKQWLHL